MADIEHDSVHRAVINSVQRNGKLDSAEIGCKMSSCFGNVFNNKLAKLGAKLRKLVFIEAFYIVRGIDFIQDIQNKTSYLTKYS